MKFEDDAAVGQVGKKEPAARAAYQSVDWVREDKGLAGNRRLEDTRLVELAQQFFAKKIPISLREVLKVCITPS